VTTLMEFSIVPLDKGPSLSPFVALVLDVVDKSGLSYRLTPMGTVVEGEWPDLVALLNRCFETVAPVSERLIVSSKFDYRTGNTSRLTRKTKSVEEKLGRTLSTS
jgi:uncharacterized protein (TIGR00106 family)